MIDIVKSFSDHCDVVRMNDGENPVRCNFERECDPDPTEHLFSDFAPFVTHGNLNADRAGFVSSRVFERDVNVAVRFDQDIDYVAPELVPLFLRRQPRLRFARQGYIRPRPFPLVNLRRRQGWNANSKRRRRRSISFGYPAINAVLALALAR